MSGYRLNVLGGFELRSESGAIVRLPTRKAEALLAYLALTPQRGQSRDSLAALLWGDDAAQSARATLRQTLSLLGKALGRGALLTQGRAVALAPGALQTDAHEFACSNGDEGNAEALERAAALYRGELLAGLAVSEPSFETWLLAERERLREHAVDLLAHLVRVRRQRGELDRAIQAALRLLALDPLLESAHRALMRLYVQQGRRGAALRQYQACVSVLERELGAEPEPETRQLYNEFLRRRGAEVGESTAPAESPVHEAPLIGREAELARLSRALAEARAQRGRGVAILGEAGIGKTRLTEELAERAVHEGMRVLAGRCYESQQLLPFAPWVELFRAAGVPADREMLEALGAPWRAELARILPEVAAEQDEAGSETAAAAQHGRLFEAIARLVAALGARKPRLLVLEDLHWADEMSLRLLAFLGRRVKEWPVMLVATARDEDLPGASRLQHVLQELVQGGQLARLNLAPLSRGDTAALVRALARTGTDEHAAARLAEQVWQASEGNPFVVVESMHASGAEPAGGSEAAAPLPERVRDLIRSRIERLGPGARRLVAVAAVAGREFDFPLLQRAAGQDELEASEALEELVRRKILGAVGERFDFTHDRIRRAVDEGLLAPKRRALHGAIADALEELHAHDPAQVCERLAYHYLRAERGDKAVAYLSHSAARAAHSGAHGDAIKALDEALRQLARGRKAPDEAERLDLVFRKARSLFFLGRFDEVLQLLAPEQANVNAAADPRVAAAYYFRLGSTQTYLGDHEGAARNARRALDEAAACGDVATMGKAHFLLALESFWAHPAEGVRHGQKAVALLEGSNERWWLGQAYWVLGLNLSYRGRFAEGLAMEERARAHAEATGDRRLASYAAWTTGFISTLSGDGDTAVSACGRSVELALDPLNRMTSLGMLALAHIERGEPAQAIPLLEEAIPQAAQFRIPQLHGLFCAFLGEARLQQGDPARARALAAQGAEITRAAGYAYGLGWTQRVLGRIARACGDRAGARARLEEAIGTFEAMGAPFETARTQLELGELLASDAAPAEARANAEAALETLEKLGLDRFAARARGISARLDDATAAAK
jgi:DNA-binding SARP family transcriptional activator